MFICIFEVFFYIIVIVNIAILITGTVWIFERKPLDCLMEETLNTSAAISTTSTPGMDDIVDILMECCDKAVYNASAFFNIFQYILHAFSIAYVLVSGVCIKLMDSYN